MHQLVNMSSIQRISQQCSRAPLPFSSTHTCFYRRFNGVNSAQGMRKVSFSTNTQPFACKNEESLNLYAPKLVRQVPLPSGGSPLYWKIRRFLMVTKQKLLLNSRQRRYNWDFGRAAFAGVPKMSYDPKINQWVTLMDNQEWGGIGGRFWIQISNTILLNVVLGFTLYFCYYRLIANNKHNVFARWANKEEDEDDGGDE